MKRKFNRNYKQIVRHPAKLFNILDSSLKEPDSIYQYYMGQGGVGRRFQETFDEKMNVKHMNVYSLSVTFFFKS